MYECMYIYFCILFSTHWLPLVSDISFFFLFSTISNICISLVYTTLIFVFLYFFLKLIMPMKASQDRLNSISQCSQKAICHCVNYDSLTKKCMLFIYKLLIISGHIKPLFTHIKTVNSLWNNINCSFHIKTKIFTVQGSHTLVLYASNN